MKLTVGNKLFLGVLTVTIFVIALIVGLAGWSLRQGFSNYLTQTELNRQELLVKRLQEIYAARGNWDLFKESPQAWQNFVESVLQQEQQEQVKSISTGAISGSGTWTGQSGLISLTSIVLSAVDATGYLPLQVAQYSGVAGPLTRPDTGRLPPPNAFQECRGKSEGDEVMHRTPEGQIRAVCMNSPEGLVARPIRPEPAHRRETESPSPVPSIKTTPAPRAVPSPAPAKPLTVQQSPAVTPAATPAVTPAVTPPAAVIEIRQESPLAILARRFTLMDRQGEQIAGLRPSMTDSVMTRPLLHDAKVVGQLGIVVAASSNLIDQAFINHSLRMLLIVAGVALLLSVLASLWMAGHVKTILREVTLATRRLASGEYSIRIESDRRDEFGDLVRDFNRLAHALEQHENNRRLWVAQTSHELRTPVSILRAHIEALVDGIRSPSPQEFAVLLRETMRLAKLINDLNDLARADSGALAFQKNPVDLVALVQEMIDSFADRFDKHQLKIVTDLCESAYVFGDESRLRQLCANLFENALRYTDAGGEVRVQIHQFNNSIQWCTEDSFPGVESSVLASLFDPFFRTDQSRHRETGGSGLGLAICRSIVNAHEGVIHADHSSLGGLKILITLPKLESHA